MKYIKKIFENLKDQIDDVENIFDYYVDNYDCEVTEGEDSDPFIYVNIYFQMEKNKNASSIKEFDNLLEINNSKIKFLEGIKTTLKRLDYLKYNWILEIDDTSIAIKVIKIGSTPKLEDALGGAKWLCSVDDGIMKKVCKEKYGLKYYSHKSEKAIPGYYGKNAQILLYFAEVLDDNNPLISDIKNLKKDGRNAFFNVQLLKWSGSRMSAIQMNHN